MLKSSKYYDFGLWFVIVSSIGLTVYSTWCGLGLTYDSFDYLAASESFRERGILNNHNGTPYNFHAPLFPVLLSFFGDNPDKSIVLVNTIICFFTLLLLFIGARKYFKNKLLYLFGCVSISINVGFQMIHHFLWTEPIFLLLFVAHNYMLLRFLERGKKIDFWFVVCAAFFMGITKNTGFFIIVISSGIILSFSNRAAFRNSAIYLIFGSIGFSMWNIYVFVFQNGQQMFINNEFITGFGINFINYTDILSQWFLPGFITFPFRLLFLALVGFMLILLKRKERLTLPVKVFLIQFLAYLIIMVVAIKVDKDEIERLLAIVSPWLLMAIYMIIDIKWEKIGYALKRPIILALILWISYTSFRGIYNSSRWHKRNCTTEILSEYENGSH